ncbi:helix-turn-helix domain-containing protein [Actinosynnema sp. NPDC053489]|uniref:helix-turn-helix domain-containing protein n=1 Tax=Actinosynnema sp. NPDC053489 TaxID=3363916 RepID=UPI0037C9FA49
MDHTEQSGEVVLRHGLERLADLLGRTWELSPRTDVTTRGGVDALVDVRPPDGGIQAQLAVEVKSRLTPRQVEDDLLPRWELIKQINSGTNLVVVAPWLDRRTRDLLRERGIGYLDLTGNVHLRVPRPAIVIHTDGAVKDPRGGAQSRAGGPTLAGPRAGRLIRALVDHAPPYRATQLAQLTGLSLPWVSKLLTRLEEQLLIRRDGRVVTEVEWPDLLRARAGSYDLLRQNPFVRMLAPNGSEHVLGNVEPRPHGAPGTYPEVVVTGHYAARQVAPVASGGQLMLYVHDGPHAVDEVADRLGLLRVDAGGDVLVMRSHDEVVFDRWREVDGIPHVALSQLVVDCLAGPGRLPAEGEAVLRYMAEHVDEWRDTGLSTG